MPSEMTMTLVEMELSMAALDALQPEGREAVEMIAEFKARIRTEVAAIDPDFGGDRLADPLDTGIVSASENEWAALADGLDTFEGDAVLDVSAGLAERARSMRDAPEMAL